MRKLVAFVIASAAIVVVVYLVRTPSATDAATATATATAAIAAARERRQQQANVPADDVSVDVTDTGTGPPPTDREHSRPVTVPLTVEQQQQAACTALAERKKARKRATLDAEPKDPTWAYSMEQKVREYLTQRLAASQIEVIEIDCKTTFCEIKAQGFVPEASGEFNAAARAASEPSWNDFILGYTLESEESGKRLLYGQLRRNQFKEIPDRPEDAQAEAACWARLIEKRQRERAARDEEPVDASWAEPTERLLRQFFTRQLGKHPLEHIDIICRTTFCKVKAKGRTWDSFFAFQNAAMAVAEEPGSDLSTGGSSGGHHGDRWELEWLLDRRAGQ